MRETGNSGPEWLQPSKDMGAILALFKQLRSMKEIARELARQIREVEDQMRAEGCKDEVRRHFEEVENDYTNVPDYMWASHPRLIQFLKERRTRLTTLISDLQTARNALRRKLHKNRCRLAGAYVQTATIHRHFAKGKTQAK